MSDVCCLTRARYVTDLVAQWLRDDPEYSEHALVYLKEGRAMVGFGASGVETKRGEPSRERLREVAQLYRTAVAVSNPPRKTVADTYGVSISTAGRWIATARGLGLLTVAAVARGGRPLNDRPAIEVGGNPLSVLSTSITMVLRRMAAANLDREPWVASDGAWQVAQELAPNDYARIDWAYVAADVELRVQQSAGCAP